MNSQEENEITLKDVILSLQTYVRYILKRTMYIAIPVIIFGAYFAYTNFKTKPTYKAERKFFVENNGSSSGLGNLGGLLGSIGIKQGKSNPYQILEVADSKLLTTDVLMSRTGEDNELLANWIIDEYKLDEKWGDSNEDLLGFRFRNDSVQLFSNLERNVLNRLIIRTVSSKKEAPLRKIILEEDRGYYAIISTTTNAELSLAIDQITYEKIRYYFEEKVLEGFVKNKLILKVKVDSLDGLLKSKIYELANFLDSNRGALTAKSKVRQGLLQKEIDAYSSAFQEMTKSYEMADFTLKNQKPTFMLIDMPFRPLSMIKPLWWIGFIRGAILGAILGIGFFVLRKAYRDIMDG